MAMFAVCHQVTPPKSFVRLGDENNWVDITGNLPDLMAPYDAFNADLIADLFSFNGITLATNKFGIFRWLGGQTWVEVFSTMDSTQGEEFDGFFAYGGSIYIHGLNRVWKYLGTSIEVVAEWSNPNTTVGGIGVFESYRRCFVYSGTPGKFVMGHMSTDYFDWVDINTGIAHASDHISGSCIFVIGLDQHGVLWSGAYADFWYYSTNNGTSWATRLSGFDGTNYVRGEPWAAVTWNNALYMTTCKPCQILRRNNTAISDPAQLEVLWSVEHQESSIVVDQEGIGFISAEVHLPNNSLYLGYGAEPFYFRKALSFYRNPADQITEATVYRWDGSTLVDIGGGLKWYDGVHIMVRASLSASNLASDARPSRVSFYGGNH